MSRTPASLEYLVVYNKALEASEDVSKDDEDAQEEAHILFYTCRPGGVKRDRMLRQVGLAKALISFSEWAIILVAQTCTLYYPPETNDEYFRSTGCLRMATKRRARWYTQLEPNWSSFLRRKNTGYWPYVIVLRECHDTEPFSSVSM